MKRYDLMQDINSRGTFVVSRACIPHLQAADEPAHPHAVAADQPRAAVARPAHRLHDRQVRDEPAARSASPRSSREDGIASNALWPRTLIATAAVQNLLGGDAAMAARAQARDRTPTPPTRSSPGPAASAPATRSCARTCWPRRASPTSTSTPTSPGAEPQVDLFVDHA